MSSEYGREWQDLVMGPPVGQPEPHSAATIPAGEAASLRLLAKCWAERDALASNLAAVQTRCTEQQEEIRNWRAQLTALVSDGRDAILVDGQVYDAGRIRALHAIARCSVKRPFHLPTAVRAFMSAAGQEMPSKPTVPSDEVVRLRVGLLAEEFFELLDACFHGGGVMSAELCQLFAEYMELRYPLDVDLEEVADALADIAYVVEGTCLAFGIDSDKVLAEVDRSNKTKCFDGVAQGAKVTKGPSYEPPDIVGVLRAQGWEG